METQIEIHNFSILLEKLKIEPYSRFYFNPSMEFMTIEQVYEYLKPRYSKADNLV